MMMIAIPRRCWRSCQQRQDLRLDGHVERGRRLVGDQHLRARWTAPSRSSRAGACRPRTRAGTGPRAAADRGSPTSSSSSIGAVPRRRLGDVPMGLDRLDQLRSDLVERMQRRQRVLEDHRDRRPPRIARSSSLASFSRSRPSNIDPAARPARPGSAVSPRVVSDETVLPEPDSPTMPERLPALHRIGDPVDGVHDPSSVGNSTRRSSTSSSGPPFALTSSGRAGRGMRR